MANPKDILMQIDKQQEELKKLISRGEPVYQIPDIKARMKTAAPKINEARWMHERLSRSIMDFESRLDKEHEVGARLVGAPGGNVFHIDDLGYWDPDLILFFGTTENGTPVQLLQHVTQLNVLLTALPKKTQEPKRIGFILEHKLEEEKEGETDEGDPEI